MNEFVDLIIKIYPLYLIVATGYLAGRFLKADRHTVSTLLIYLISPVVVFYGVVSAPVNNTYLLLPLVFFITANLLSFIFYEVGKLFWHTNEKNLLSAAAGSGNTGYFGLPLVLSLFGDKGLSIAVFCLLGTILYESTRNYYILAKSHSTAQDALIKVLKLPSFYAFTLGLVVNRVGITIDGSLLEAFTYFKGAYVVFGMMIIGIVLASATKGHFDTKLTVLAFIAKFIGYPSVIGLFVVLDSTTFGLFGTQVHSIMLLLSIVPIAANTITYATLLKARPEKAALTVLASTLFALVYIPAFIAVFIK